MVAPLEWVSLHKNRFGTLDRGKAHNDLRTAVISVVTDRLDELRMFRAITIDGR